MMSTLLFPISTWFEFMSSDGMHLATHALVIQNIVHFIKKMKSAFGAVHASHLLFQMQNDSVIRAHHIQIIIRIVFGILI